MGVGREGGSGGVGDADDGVPIFLEMEIGVGGQCEAAGLRERKNDGVGTNEWPSRKNKIK